MTRFIEGPRSGAFLSYEVDRRFRATDILLQHADAYLPGTVLAKRAVGDVVVVAAGGTNTGNGVLDAATILTGKAVQQGAYTLTAKTADTFEVVTPNGAKLKDAKVGEAYAGSTHLSGFTITAGGTAFVAGDTFTVTVSSGDGKVVRLDPEADDGSQLFYGILFGRVDAVNGDEKGVIVRRLAGAADDRLIWPDGITADQKAAAIAAADANHLIIS